MTAAEEWRPVVGWEGWYEVSNLGRVKRVAGGPGVKQPILSPWLAKVGYLVVTLSHGTIPTRKKRYVHQLVAEAFIGPCPPGHEVNHKDTVKLNNPAGNLEYVTSAGNTHHACENGVFPRGETNGHSKLTEAAVQQMRSMYPALSYRKIAALFGVECSTARSAIRGDTWKHVA